MPDQRGRPGATAPSSPSDDTRLRLPPQATQGLLEYLSSHALDEDYAFVSERRETRERLAARADGTGDRTPASRPRRRSSVGPLGALAVAAFAVLVVVAGLQTHRGAGDDRAEQRQLARQVADARTQLATDRADLVRLQREVDRTQRQQLGNDASSAGLRRRTSELGALTGTLAVSGQGVRVVADDAPGATSTRNQVLDTDLQKLVNGFWQAGAEAISVDGQRLTTLSTIRLAGGAITVNARSLRRPYVVDVIGDRNTLPARFAETSSGQAWLDLQRQVGLRLSITPRTDLRLPGLDVTLRYARAAGQTSSSGPSGASGPSGSTAASPTPPSSPSSPATP